MAPASKRIALVLVGLTAVACALASAQDPPACTDLSAARDYHWPKWFPGPDGCQPPHLLYESPRGPWYVVADLVALKRDADGEQDFASLGTPDDIALSTEDLRFEFQAGPRVLVGHQFSDWYAIEASYFGLMDWDESRAIRDVTANALGTAGNLFSPFSDFGDPAGLVGLDFNNFASIRLVSSLDNAEVNIRQRLDTPPSIMQATVLYGFRYMNIRERFEYATESAEPAGAGTANFVNVETGNDLYGFQIGGMMELRVEPRAWLSFEWKGVVCHNDADQTTDFATGPLGAPTAPIIGERGEERTTFVGDASITIMYAFTPACVGRIGYQALWVDGLALASQNFERNISLLTLGPAQLVHDGNLVYHGPFAGLMWSW
jgi:putative beta barrel porin BBP7